MKRKGQSNKGLNVTGSGGRGRQVSSGGSGAGSASSGKNYSHVAKRQGGTSGRLPVHAKSSTPKVSVGPGSRATSGSQNTGGRNMLANRFGFGPPVNRDPENVTYRGLYSNDYVKRQRERNRRLAQGGLPRKYFGK
jgi:hypothetical protein